ncbi:MAG TPA: hypothetical protein VMR88_07040 [Candidatus Polarisedimenticolaceae bacterium]|nr:hypothetical protein [Candidatus Polarisedimenticolaceae bacterium]
MDREAIAFLIEAINQSDEEIWQEALDGLVALPSPEALAVLTATSTRELPIDRRANDSNGAIEYSPKSSLADLLDISPIPDPRNTRGLRFVP